MANILSLSEPWRVDNLEHWTAAGRMYWVVDRNSVLVAMFLDEKHARAVVELVNGSGRIPREIGGRN